MIHIALDFGNSRVKCYAQGPQLLGAFAYSTMDWDNQLHSTIMLHIGEEKCRIGISSVNPAMDQQFTAIMEGMDSISHIRTKSLLMQSNTIDFSSIQGMGEDRMHGLAGALTCAKPPLVTIDCGTAITFNIVNEHSTCLGGAIMPGFSTMYNALSASTSGLPQLAPNPMKAVSGKTTNDAIHAGITVAISGAISKYLDHFPEYSFFIFGGDAEIILEIMDDNAKKRLHSEPYAIAKGIFTVLASIEETHS